MPASFLFLRTFYFRITYALPVKSMPEKSHAPTTIMWFSFQAIFSTAVTPVIHKFSNSYSGLFRYQAGIAEPESFGI
jgi:hypothetical protein